jgi:hypothetical protein
MKTPLTRLLFWTPRILCILFAGFISLFAADVLGQGNGFWQTMLALFMHLIPTWIVLIVLAIAWRREWVGAIVFVLLGVVYLVHFWGRFPWATYLVISGPLFLIGILFSLDWFCGRGVRTSASA